MWKCLKGKFITPEIFFSLFCFFNSQKWYYKQYLGGKGFKMYWDEIKRGCWFFVL